MRLNKQYEVEIKAAPDDAPEGTITAYASVFGTVDLVGDRVIAGAFTKSLRKWRETGDPIPIILNHQWGDVNAHIGIAKPADVKQTPHGLLGTGQLDVKDNPIAAQTYKLLKRRSLKAFSFGYRVLDEELDSEGVNNLKELDLIEFGPTLRGAHPDAELVGVKHAVEATLVKDANLRQRTEEAALEVAMGGDPAEARKAAGLRSSDPNLVDQLVDGILLRFADLGVLDSEAAKAVWSTAYVNNLPDSAFLYVAPGGSKDEEGKTTPRSLRYFPVRDANGKVDLAHVRNALARIPQSNCPEDAKKKATADAERLLNEADNAKRLADDVTTEPDPDEPKLPATGKRDDELRRQTERVALDLALGREPAPLPAAIKEPKKKEDDDTDAKAAVTQIPGAPQLVLVNPQAPLDQEAVVKAVIDRLDIKEENDDDDEPVDDGGKALRRRTEKAARGLIKDNLPPAGKSTKQLQSELMDALSEAGQARWDGPTTYVYVRDYDPDKSLVIYCVRNDREPEQYLQVSYVRSADGDVTLGDQVTPVEEHTSYAAKSAPEPPQPQVPPYGMPMVWLNQSGVAPDQDAIVDAVLDKLGKTDDGGKSKDDPLRKRTEKVARDLIREQLGPAAKAAPSQDATYDADAIAARVAQLLGIKADNWVDQEGGLPDYIKRIAKHLVEKGMLQGHAIATAVNAAKKMCASGDVNFPGVQHVNPTSQAEACAAVAEWERMKLAANAHGIPTEVVKEWDDLAVKLERTRTEEVEKPIDEKSSGTKSGGRDPLRKRTERQALEQALGRSAQDVPDIAHPEPPKEREVPDEKTLRRQTDRAALDLALGGFE